MKHFPLYEDYNEEFKFTHLFAKVNLTDQNDPVCVNEKSKVMQRSVYNILNDIESVLKNGSKEGKRIQDIDNLDSEYLRQANANAQRDNKMKIYKKRKAQAKKPQMAIDGTSNSETNNLLMKSLSNKYSLIGPPKVKDKKPIHKHEKIAKRFGDSKDGFFNSLMMSTDKNFNISKFLQINMYSVLKGPNNKTNNSNVDKNKQNNKNASSKDDKKSINLAFKKKQLTLKASKESLFLDESDYYIPYKTITQGHISTRNSENPSTQPILSNLDKRKSKIFSGDFPSNRLDSYFHPSETLPNASNIYNNTINPTESSIIPTHNNHSKSIPTFTSNGDPKSKNIPKTLRNSDKVLPKNFNSLNKVFQNKMFKSFDYVSENLKEIKSTLKLDRKAANKLMKENFNKNKFKKDLNDFEILGKIKQTKKGNYNDCFIKQLKNTIAKYDVDPKQSVDNFLMTSDKYKSINPNTFYKFKKNILSGDRKLYEGIRYPINSERIINATKSFQKRTDNDIKALSNNNSTLKILTNVIRKRKQSIIESIK